MKTAHKYKSESETATAPEYAGLIASSQIFGPHPLFGSTTDVVVIPLYETRAAPSNDFYAAVCDPSEYAVRYVALTGATLNSAFFEAKTWGSNTTTATLLKDFAATIARNLKAVVVDDPLEGYDQYSKPNWDGFDAEPITSETLNCAREILRTRCETIESE